MAGTLGDEILRVTGGPTIPDGLRAFYTTRGVVVNTNVNDMEMAYLRVQPGVTLGPRNDMFRQYLTAKGYLGTLNDQLIQWWSANAPV